MSDLTDILDDVLYAHKDHISTHHTGCHVNHAGCLAALLRDRLEDHLIRSNN